MDGKENQENRSLSDEQHEAAMKELDAICNAGIAQLTRNINTLAEGLPLDINNR